MYDITCKSNNNFVHFVYIGAIGAVLNYEICGEKVFMYKKNRIGLNR